MAIKSKSHGKPGDHPVNYKALHGPDSGTETILEGTWHKDVINPVAEKVKKEIASIKVYPFSIKHTPYRQSK